MNLQTELLFTDKRMKGLWKAIVSSRVPLVTKYDIQELNVVLQDLRTSISSNKYLPAVPLGYLGIPKGVGVTRFIPIISKEDLLVYYSLTLAMQDFLIEDIPNVFGAYRVIPKKAQKNKGKFTQIKAIKSPDEITNFDWGYSFGESLAKKAWFKNWQKYVEFLEDAISAAPSHYQLITSDIANFYDSINIDKLDEMMNRALAAGKADEEFFDIKDLLITFLKHWDRRLNGYQASSKGIPQEIVGDASRILANFYLRKFDEKFKAYCDSEHLTYTRWADDIVVFGSSKRKLEAAIHKASRILLELGLHLNSSKTQLFRKKAFREYRALEFLKVANSNNEKRIVSELKKIKQRIASGEAIRFDTVFSRTLTYVEKTKTKSLVLREFIDTHSKEYDTLRMLNGDQYLKLIAISDDPKKTFKYIYSQIVKFPYANPKSEFLRMLWKNEKRLLKIGITNGLIKTSISQIREHSGDSVVLLGTCIPKAEAIFKV